MIHIVRQGVKSCSRKLQLSTPDLQQFSGPIRESRKATCVVLLTQSHQQKSTRCWNGFVAFACTITEASPFGDCVKELKRLNQPLARDEEFGQI
jgi:hypothetical protein